MGVYCSQVQTLIVILLQKCIWFKFKSILISVWSPMQIYIPYHKIIDLWLFQLQDIALSLKLPWKCVDIHTFFLILKSFKILITLLTVRKMSLFFTHTLLPEVETLKFEQEWEAWVVDD